MILAWVPPPLSPDFGTLFWGAFALLVVVSFIASWPRKK